MAVLSAFESVYQQKRSRTPCEWKITSNDGTNIVANNPATGETISDTQTNFKALFTNINDNLNEQKVQVIASGASPAVDLSAGLYVKCTLSTATVTFGAPTKIPPKGRKVTFEITQDGTGGRTLAFNAAYLFAVALSNTGNTANKKTTIEFISNGSNLVSSNANVWA